MLWLVAWESAKTIHDITCDMRTWRHLAWHVLTWYAYKMTWHECARNRTNSLWINDSHSRVNMDPKNVVLNVIEASVSGHKTSHQPTEDWSLKSKRQKTKYDPLTDRRPKDQKTERPKDWKTKRPKDQKTKRPKDRKTERPKDRKTERLKDWKTKRLKDQKTKRLSVNCLEIT